MKQYAFYIMASKRNGVLYSGVSGDLRRRVWQHRNGVSGGFVKKHKTRMLVYYELHGDVREAILREKRVKKWKRQWKMRIIEEQNPVWDDLYPGIV